MGGSGGGGWMVFGPLLLFVLLLLLLIREGLSISAECYGNVELVEYMSQSEREQRPRKERGNERSQPASHPAEPQRIWAKFCTASSADHPLAVCCV